MFFWYQLTQVILDDGLLNGLLLSTLTLVVDLLQLSVIIITMICGFILHLLQYEHRCISVVYKNIEYAHIRTQPFYCFLAFVWDNSGKLVPEGTFRHLLDFLVQNEDDTGRHTNNPDGLPPHPD